MKVMETKLGGRQELIETVSDIAKEAFHKKAETYVKNEFGNGHAERVIDPAGLVPHTVLSYGWIHRPRFGLLTYLCDFLEDSPINDSFERNFRYHTWEMYGIFTAQDGSGLLVPSDLEGKAQKYATLYQERLGKAAKVTLCRDKLHHILILGTDPVEA